MIQLLLALSISAATPIETAVACHEVAFSRSVESHDIEAFRAFLDEQVLFVSGPTARGPDAVVASWSALLSPESPNIRWWPDRVEVRADGTLALSQGPWEATVETEDGTQLSAGRFISTWQHQDDGGWKIIFDTGTPGGPIDEPLQSPWTDAEFAAKCGGN